MTELDVATLTANLGNPAWRIANLYKIITKGDDDDDLVVKFVPNRAQRKLMMRLHHRDIILKARQLGFTTLIAILWLDTALFSKDPIRCGIIAHSREDAEVIFRDKVKFAYDNLHPLLRERMPLKRDSAVELLFGHNGSSVRVATSMRSGTIHRLHISEFGKICAKYPDKAKEVVTGSIPAVPKSGVCVIESTAEGQDGKFYEMTQAAMAAQERGLTLTAKDWKFFFFAWWDAPEYSIDPTGIVFSEADQSYFTEVESKIGRTLMPGQRAWYVTTRRADFADEAPLMWQEYPSCIAGHVLVGTPNGIMPIKDVVPDGKIIQAHTPKGIRPAFEVRTRLGYSVTCTDDHPIKTADGSFRKIVEGLSVGDSIQLSRPALSAKQVSVDWSPAPFVDGKIHITPEFAEFLGMFMGDGSFYNGTISVACDANDLDTVAAVESMFDRFLGGHGSRVTGGKLGCLEVRKASEWFAEPMLALGIVEKRSAGGLKRKVHVPPFIFRSPEDVVCAFLRGLFEADGFAARDGTSIKFFSKHQHVVQDVQILLLALGIESRISGMTKVSKGYEYFGWELAIRANGVRKFAPKVGFISKRKQDRAMLSMTKRKTGSNANFAWQDEIVSIAPAGETEVFDITTASHEFDAGGIVVHNCPEEAFQVSTEGCYYATQIAFARKQGRVLPTLPVETVPVNTFWDIGRGDMTTVWFHQRVGPENRFIKYYEASGEDVSHYVEYLQKTGFIFGTHYLPHETDHKRMGATSETNRTIKEMFEDLYPGQRFEKVDRVLSISTGIQATRNVFSSCWFSEEGCKDGIRRLTNYRKQWDKTRGCWMAEPLHNDDSHGADAFRQFGQVADAGTTFNVAASRPSVFRRKGSPMSAR